MDDFELAKRLQEEEFGGSHEKLAKSPSNKENKPSSVPSSLTDPTWELIDPTPNIYTLFQAFDKKYFWSALQSVEVKWSPRMTSCAGICTYKGRRGGCVISLSLPLLKLRPRKDLVETLLHEMIHAYLFLTANDRDRDGHGPQFHYHMYRINAEAGTKISVYHSFHDEVRHYKTHWWRCDGPCRSKHPFYGIVKRAMNRPPGPNDFWFADHQATCGGTFVKIQEPEGFKSKKKKIEVPNKSPDIRKYLTPNSPLSNFNPGGTKSFIPGASKEKKNSKVDGSSKPAGKPNPIRNLFNNPSKPPPSRPPSAFPANANNVHGFQKSASSTANRVNGSANVHGFGSSTAGGFQGGLKSNMGGTLIQNPKVLGKRKSDSLPGPNGDAKREAVVPFAGTGYVLGALGSGGDRFKSKLMSLFSPAEKKPKVEVNHDKRESKVNVSEPSKVPKGSKPSKLPQTSSVVSGSTKVPCPACGVSVDEVNVNEHLDACLKMDFGDTMDDANLPPSPSKSLFVNCPVCGKSVYKTKINEHVSDCLNADQFVDLTEEPPFDTSAPSTSSSTPSFESSSPSKALFNNCPVCDKKVYKSKMDEHLDACVRLDSIMDSSGMEIADVDLADEKETGQVQCPCCDRTFTPETINAHLDSCLQSLDFD